MKPTFYVTKKDLTVTWFSGSGCGGQHRNSHKNCCRIKHNDTGVIATGQSHKERKANQKEALKNLVKHPKFRRFCEIGLEEIESGIKSHERIKKEVDILMRPENFEDIKSDKDFRILTKNKKKTVINGVEIYE